MQSIKTCGEILSVTKANEAQIMVENSNFTNLLSYKYTDNCESHGMDF